jgi:hypothetical protein
MMMMLKYPEFKLSTAEKVQRKLKFDN